MRRRRSAVALALLICTAASAGADPPCTMTQVTDWGFYEYWATSVSGDGRFFAYYGNPVGGLYDVFLRDNLTGGWAQVTNTEVHSANPDLSLEGRWMTFISQADFTGGNADGSFEVFLLELATGAYVQATSLDVGPQTPRTSAEGRRTLYVSNADPTGSNPDGSFECFLYDRFSGQTTQVVTGEDDRSCVMDAEGRAVLVTTSDDLLGLNPDGNDEIFRVEIDSGLLTQLTHTVTGANRALWATDDGGRFAFQSTCEELLPNDATLPGVFVYDLAGPAITFVAEMPFSSFSLELSGAGNRIVAAYGGSGFRLWDLATGERRTLYVPQTTSLPRVRGIDRWGTRFYTQLRDDATGGNPDGSLEVFRFDCPIELFADGFETGDTTRWSSTLP